MPLFAETVHKSTWKKCTFWYLTSLSPTFYPPPPTSLLPNPPSGAPPQGRPSFWRLRFMRFCRWLVMTRQSRPRLKPSPADARPTSSWAPPTSGPWPWCCTSTAWTTQWVDSGVSTLYTHNPITHLRRAVCQTNGPGSIPNWLLASWLLAFNVSPWDENRWKNRIAFFVIVIV